MVLRPKELHWPGWLDAKKAKVDSGLGQLNEEIVACRDFITLATIAAGCALSWLEFRMPEIQWRTEHRNLANFLREFEQRQSMKHTLPQNATTADTRARHHVARWRALAVFQAPQSLGTALSG